MESLQVPILWLMLAGYVGALAVFAIGFWVRNEALQKLAVKISYIGLLFNGIEVVLRMYLIHGLPLNNGFEFGLSFIVVMMVAYVVLENRMHLGAISLFVLPVAVAISCWLVSVDLTIQPVMPALRSYWLAVHVSCAVIAYGSFSISFAVAIAYLLKEKQKGSIQSRLVAQLPNLKKLDDLCYRLIFVGLPFLTIMLVTGSVWAEYAWGSFWSWDPKETWALITWLIYAIYLHSRLMRGFDGKKSAWIAVIGFAAVIFTFFGVSYLLPGMHSYLS